MAIEARKYVLSGRVQGVGYRPFVYNRAVELGLAGTVLNGAGKVYVHAEGEPGKLDRLAHDLVHSAPPLARPCLDSMDDVEPAGIDGFRILASEDGGETEIHVPPDLFTCDDCLAELSDPSERRFGYPFINCTQCGPRYTIITAMPYDRPNTSMAAFPLCPDCEAEYRDPGDRRFHAQPLACAVCGPRLEFVTGEETCTDDPLDRAIEALSQGKILAIKGVGGYHLVCDAANDDAVRSLRERKRRPDKPLAVMFPLRGEDGLDAAREHLDLDSVTARAISDPARPIVLAPIRTDRAGPSSRNLPQPFDPSSRNLPQRFDPSSRNLPQRFDPSSRNLPQRFDPSSRNLPPGKYPGSSEGVSVLSEHLAPGLKELGVFLPYSPLHHELLDRFEKPIVATSGNVSGEPVITDNVDARERLGVVADAFLHHDRPIVRPADDPVVRPMAGRARLIRPGRGIAPIELGLPGELSRPMLAAGGHMKNTVALAWNDRVVISPHIGDLDSPRSNDVFQQVIKDLQNLYDVEIEQIASDLHPGYASTRWAGAQGLPSHPVQHHAAHASALAGEHPDVARWLVFTWDGVGYGADGSLWGGEALAGRPGSWKRVSSFRPFRLVGGDRAGREPWRSAAALLWESGEVFKTSSRKPLGGYPGSSMDPKALDMAYQAWSRNLNTFTSSAAGRLFDAAAAFVLNRTLASFEGQGPMELEQIAQPGAEGIDLPLDPDEAGVMRVDWKPLLNVLRDDDVEPWIRAGMFHETMARSLVAQARALRERFGFEAVGLSGGVFQNRLLTERALELLQADGFEVRLHERIPANDGGLCYGQVIETLALQNQT